MATIVVWGSDRDIGRNTSPLRRLAQYLYGNYTIPGFAPGDDAVAEIQRIVAAHAPVAIYGFSSLLRIVAERSLALGYPPCAGSVAVAWNGGEMLYESQSEVFRQAFGVPILNRYGGRELSTTTFQEVEGGPHIILRPWVFLEIVDDAGKPAAPGEVGRLILTSTINRGTPFLRYDIGDLGAYASEECDESGIGCIRELHGRSSGSLRLQDGRTISGLYWNHLLKDYPEVSQFQVRIGKGDEITLLLRGQGFTADRSSQLEGALRVLMQNQQVAWRWVDCIPRSPQGKLIQTVRE
jgi:phenylacetate-CoA ligase